MANASGGMKWENRISSFHDLLVACVGYNFGSKPAERIEEIREIRGEYGVKVIDWLNLGKDDVVMDVGSGCGFIGCRIAPHVKQIVCADLNEDF